MRIVFATGNPYLPENIGGVERNTQALYRLLRPHGISSAVLAALTRTGPVSLVHRAARKLYPAAKFVPDRIVGCPVYRFWQPAADVGTVARAFRPSVAIVQSPEPAELAAGFMAQGIPVVVYFHDVLFAAAPLQLAPHPLLSQLAVSEFVAGLVRETHGVQPPVVRTVVIPDHYRTETSRREVLFINPRPEKGADIAWALARARPDIPFRFVEAWSRDPKLRADGLRRARQLGNVTWCRSHTDMRRLYARAKLVLVPSRVEDASPRVVTEAQVSGIPALASDRGGLPEVVGPGGLTLSPDADPAAWVTALSRLWDDDAAYRACVDASLRHAQRPEIAPLRIAEEFLAHVSRHLAACDRVVV